MPITQTELSERLSYDPDTGLFFWRDGRHKGKKAGVLRFRYVMIMLNGRYYRGHHLAWLYVYGKWPGQLDHKNRIRWDNRISNLRKATRVQNYANRGMKRTNTSGATGVQRIKSGNYQSTLTHRGKTLHLGVYPTLEDAAKVYRDTHLKIYGEFSRYSV